MVLLCTEWEGWGLSSGQLLSSWQPGHYSAPLASSWHECVCPLSFLDEFACLSLEILSSSRALCLYEAKLHTSQIMSYTNLLCLVSIHSNAQLAHVLGYFVALVEAIAMGQCRAVAPAFHWLLRWKAPFLLTSSKCYILDHFFLFIFQFTNFLFSYA